MKPLHKALFAAIVTPAVFAAFAPSALAQELAIVAPAAVTQEGRFMPGFGSEAIVKALYTVKADGTVADVAIVSYLSNQFLNNMISENVAKWTFKPATLDGKAIDLHNQEYTFAIRVDPNAPAPAMGGRGGRGGPPPAPAEGAEAPPPVDYSKLPPVPLALTAAIKTAVDEISALVAEKDYEKALKKIEKLSEESVYTVFDYSLLHELRTSILMAESKPYEALDASILATLSTVNARGETEYFLTDDMLQGAMRQKFLLAASLRQNALAWDVYQTLQGKFTIPAEDKIHEQATAVKALLDSPEPLGLLAQITNEQWSYKPTRRIFTVADVDGKLNMIKARCERKDLELEYQEGVDWTLPPALGKCELDFLGKDGTKFTVYEFTE